MQNELFLKHFDYNKSLLKILLDFSKVKVSFDFFFSKLGTVHFSASGTGLHFTSMFCILCMNEIYMSSEFQFIKFFEK